MIVRLDQYTKDEKREMFYEFKNYAVYESILIVLHFDGTSILVMWVLSPGIISLLCLKQ